MASDFIWCSEVLDIDGQHDEGLPHKCFNELGEGHVTPHKCSCGFEWTTLEEVPC